MSDWVTGKSNHAPDSGACPALRQAISQNRWAMVAAAFWRPTLSSQREIRQHSVEIGDVARDEQRDDLPRPRVGLMELAVEAADQQRVVIRGFAELQRLAVDAHGLGPPGQRQQRLPVGGAQVRVTG